jgi:hypothetical protein
MFLMIQDPDIRCRKEKQASISPTLRKLDSLRLESEDTPDSKPTWIHEK